MDKRQAKRHKRHVARARAHVKQSEPDVRTPEELEAAREAGRQAGGQRNGAPALYAGGATRTSQAPAILHRAKDGS